MSSKCPLCGKEKDLPIFALFVGNICQKCENLMERRPTPKLLMSQEEKEHNKIYKKFLAGKVYPEIQVTHTAKDGAVAEARLARWIL